jgi:hypothetical protein
MNNLVEQDHRFVKKRVVASQWFRSVDGALNTIAGYEAMNIIRKGQIRWLPKTDIVGQMRFVERTFASLHSSDRRCSHRHVLTCPFATLPFCQSILRVHNLPKAARKYRPPRLHARRSYGHNAQATESPAGPVDPFCRQIRPRHRVPLFSIATFRA